MQENKTQVEHGKRLSEAFLGWQCRIRQYAIRKANGRPSKGMRPSVFLGGATDLGPVTTVLNKADPQESIMEFRHIVKRNNDPRLRFEEAIKKLQVNYFQRPLTFSDRVTATFPPDSKLAEQLVQASSCQLCYSQSNQEFRMQVRAEKLEKEDAFYEATFWHNAMFNPGLSLDHEFLQFIPDWRQASADPTPLQ